MISLLLTLAAINVSHPVALVDQPITIEVTELTPFQRGTMHATTRDDEGELWCSQVEFQADAKGVSFLEDPMALFFSMKTKEFKSFRPKSFDVVLTVDGATRTISRLGKSPDVTKIVVSENGLVGALFVPASEKPLPAIIVLSGSNGGIGESRAQLLASHGFVVLGLGYFGMEGLPPQLDNIPLEYFEKAFSWLQKRKEVQGDSVGLYGISRGAELSLLLGSYFPDKIKAIVATVPSNIIHGPSWQYQGKPILSHGAPIPVERIKCPVLLISGGDDKMWPSSPYSRQIKERLKSPCTHLDYPKAGHLINIPYLPACDSLYFHPVALKWFDMGGSAKEDDLASRDSWLKVISFCKNAMSSSK